MRYYKLYANTFDKLNELAKFLKTHKLLKLIQKEIENLNLFILSKEIDVIIKNFHHKENSRPRWLHTWIIPIIPSIISKE